MEPTGLAATEGLEILLEQQVMGLANARGQAERILLARGLEPSSAEWRGIARNAYDARSSGLDSELRCIARALGEAEVQTGRALATLRRRVG